MRQVVIIHAVAHYVINDFFYLQFEQKAQDEKRKKEDAEKQNRAEQEKLETEAAERAKKEVSSVDSQAKEYQNNFISVGEGRRRKTSERGGRE